MSTSKPNSFCKREVKSSRFGSKTGDREFPRTTDVECCNVGPVDGAAVELFDSNDIYEF